MRLKGLLLLVTFVVAAGSPPAVAQLPPLPQLPPVPQVPPVPPPPEAPQVPPLPAPLPDVTKPVDEPLPGTPAPAPAPVEGPAAPAPGSGGGGTGGDGSGPAANAGPGAQAGAAAGSTDGISHRCPGEGILGGTGGSGGGTLAASPPNGGQPTGEGVLGTGSSGESGGPVGAIVDAASHAGPFVLAVFAFGALLLLAGLGGGLRALHGRLRSG